MRRAYEEGRTTFQRPLRLFAIWMMFTPWAFCDFDVFSAVQLAVPSGNRSPSSVYSLFWTRRPSLDPLSGK